MKPPTCTFDPKPLINLPLGMFHCPECGEMVVAGCPHPGIMEESDWEDLERRNKEIDQQHNEWKRKKPMAKEILSVPESKLAEVIMVIRTGLDYVKVSEGTKVMLLNWCDEEEEYIRSSGFGDGECSNISK